MSTTPGVVTAVRWNEICPWLLLVRAARVAVLLRVIVLATVGVFVTQWGWAAIERVVLGMETDVPALTRLTDAPPPPLLSMYLPTVAVDLLGALDRHWWAGPLVRGWAWALQPLTRLASAPGLASSFAFVLAGVWVMAVWALFGGAIARIAALYLTRGEILGPWAALKSAAAKWASTFAAPSFCFGIIAVFALLLVAVGFVIRLSPLAFLAGVVWPMVLLLGVALAIFALGLLIGWPFMWSTVAAERTDAFDAVSRGYAFAFQRPLHLVFMVIVATAIGLLAQTAVSLVVGGALNATWWGVSRGAGEPLSQQLLFGPALNPTAIDGQPLGSIASAGGNMMRFWTGGLAAIATAFPMAYLWPAAMGIYLLLRRLIDSTELGEVALDEGEPDRGLPPLVKDPTTGVPTVQAVVPAPAPAAAATSPAGEPVVGDPTATITELRGGPS